MKTRVLFILKFREEYGNQYSTRGLSSGLFNSARMVADMLNSIGIEAKMVQVVDNNDIDREVHKYKPTHVIIEALWVVPSKFDVLIKLHPTVKWIVRIHSEIPFLANEGVAFEWIYAYYQQKNVYIAPNSKTALRDIRAILIEAGFLQNQVESKVIYLPNYYPVTTPNIPHRPENGVLNVGCFGAIRPMKNQLIQAVAAVEAAHALRKHLRFHINSTRTEQGGEHVLRNLRALMKMTWSDLVEHPWVPHEEFVKLVATMDIGLQVSFSETFNIVAADTVNARVPIVVSPEVSWVNELSQADPNNAKDIKDKMLSALGWKGGLYKRLNLMGLKDYSEDSVEIWRSYLRSK